MPCAFSSCSPLWVGQVAHLPVRKGVDRQASFVHSKLLILQAPCTIPLQQRKRFQIYAAASDASHPPGPPNILPPQPSTISQRRPMPVVKPYEPDPAERVVRTLGAFMFALPILEAYYRALVLCIERLRQSTLEYCAYFQVRMCADGVTPAMKAQYTRLLEGQEVLLLQLNDASELLGSALKPCIEAVSALPSQLQWLADLTSMHAVCTLSLLLGMFSVAIGFQQDRQRKPTPSGSTTTTPLQQSIAESTVSSTSTPVSTSAYSSAPRPKPVSSNGPITGGVPQGQALHAALYCALMLWLGISPFLSGQALLQQTQLAFTSMLQNGGLVMTISGMIAGIGAAFRLLKGNEKLKDLLQEVFQGTTSVVNWMKVLAFCYVASSVLFGKGCMDSKGLAIMVFALYAAVLEFIQTQAKAACGVPAAAD